MARDRGTRTRWALFRKRGRVRAKRPTQLMGRNKAGLLARVRDWDSPGLEPSRPAHLSHCGRSWAVQSDGRGHALWVDAGGACCGMPPRRLPAAETNTGTSWTPLTDDTTRRNGFPLTQQVIEKQTVVESIGACRPFGQFSLRTRSTGATQGSADGRLSGNRSVLPHDNAGLST